MNVIDKLNQAADNIPPLGRNNALSEAAGCLSREAKMIALGSWEAVADTARHPLDKLPELGLSAATGADDASFILFSPL